MENTALKLLETLATKLDTTTEYVWSVLIKQAPISAITNVSYLIISIIVPILLWKLHSYFYRQKMYESEYSEFVITLMGALTLLTLICLGVGIALIPSIISGLFNPEYWALQQILSYLK